MDGVSLVGRAQRRGIKSLMGWSAASRTQAREMRVERGGAEAGVAEVVLNEGEGDARFEEMRGVAVAERMHMGALVHAALFDRAPEGALQRGPGDGRRGKNRNGMAAGGSVPRRKEPEWIAVGAPVRAQERERGVGERHVAILAALAVDVEQRAIAVDVRHLQANAFHEAKPAGVDRGEADAVRVDPHGVEDPPHFALAQHDGAFLRAPGGARRRAPSTGARASADGRT